MSFVNYAKSAGKDLGQGILEKDSGFVPVIDSDHARVHNDQMFQNFQENLALANNGTVLFEYIVPADKALHLKGMSAWVTEQHWRFELIAAPTLTTGATPLANKPFHWPSTIVNPIVCKSNPTGISGGTVIASSLFGGGSGVGQTIIAGNASKALEHELGAGTYLVRITNLSGGAAKISANLFWYFTYED